MTATLIEPNAAVRTRERAGKIFMAGDWAALRALSRGDFEFDDRRKVMGMRGDVELLIKSLEVNHSGPSMRHGADLVGTVGDRVALERVLWTGGSAGEEFEAEYLRLTEVDAEGRLAAFIFFDPDDRAAAFAEAHERFAAGEGAVSGGQVPIARLYRALAQRDWEAVRDCLAHDAVVDDRRVLGMGALDREQWLAARRSACDLAVDARVEPFRLLAWNRHGRVGVTRLCGTLNDGGPFENPSVVVILTNRNRITRQEFFDIGDADQALVRFEELCS